MGDSRKADYEMAPTSDPEKAGGEMQPEPAEEWTGLGKEELLRVADTTGWKLCRNILLVLFWVAWVAMLIAAIVIVVKVPRCPDVEWWQKDAIYQIFPRSFRDSDGDGVGDIKGVTENLDYLNNIGVKIVYLNSIFEQPKETTDIGYDIVDFTNVDPLLGTLADFDGLIAAAQEKGMKVILEFVPNHSSNKHPWFNSSMSAKDSMYSDYYIWADPSSMTDPENKPPNDWKNAYGESAWTYVPEREQFYYHRFQSSQPDLNYYNESLNDAVLSAMEFWLDRKVDGFVFTNVDYLLEPQLTKIVLGGDASSRRRRQAADATTPVPDTTDAATTGAPAAGTEPAAEPTTGAGDSATDAPMPAETPTSEPQPEPGSGDAPSDPTNPYSLIGEEAEAIDEKLMSVLKEWRSLLGEKSTLGKYRLMVTQSQSTFDLEKVIMQYGKNDSKSHLADYPFNLALVEVLKNPLDGEAIIKAVQDFLQAKKEAGLSNRWNTWALGSHDTKRIASRVGESYVRALNVLLYTLPGTPISYYGEELGLEDIKIASIDDVVDPVALNYPAKWMELTRDPERAPLPWGKGEFRNFTTGNSTWLPLSKQENISIEVQMQEGAVSTLNQLSMLAEYHGKASIVAGDFKTILTTSSIISYIRSYPEWPVYMVVMNVGTKDVLDNFHTKDSKNVPETGRVILSTNGAKKDYISMDGLSLAPGEAVLVEFPPA